MSRLRIHLALAAASMLAAVACWVPDLPWLDGKACDDVHLCIRGVCLAGQCVLTPPGKDASTLTPVLVARSTLHALDDGTVASVQEVPANLDMLVETTGGTFVTLQPTAADAGLMVFWDAPPGQAYVLRLGSRHFVSDAGFVDLSERVLGRPDLTAPSPGTKLRSQVGCLNSWEALDEIQLTSAGAGLGAVDLATLPGWTPPAVGTGSLDTSQPWTTAATPGLIQTPRGDHPIYVQLEHSTQNQARADGGGQVATDRWMGKRAQFDFPLDMQDGVETTLSLGGCKDINPRSAPQYAVRGAAFGDHVGELGPGATLTGLTSDVRLGIWPAGPGATSYRTGWSTPDDVTVNPQTPNSSPYPATWALEADAVMSGIVPVVLQLGDAGSTIAYEKVVMATRRPFPVTGNELAPALSPPQLVAVNGQDATAGLTSVGMQPEVTWTAPALGTPAGYEVAVWRQQDPSRQKLPRLEGTIWTDVPRVRIPPGLMTPQATYVLHVRAVAAPMDPRRAPLLVGLPYDEAETVTGLLEP